MTTLGLPSLRFGLAGADYRDYITQLASRAGVRINGPNPWDMRINDQRTYQRIMSHGSIGAGEAYMDGWWDCDQVDEFFTRVLKTGMNRPVERRGAMMLYLMARLQNLQTPRRSRKVAHSHYDLSPTLYASMLDRRMIYSCGYWANADTLDDAQEHKLDLVCRKLQLEPGMHLLDIGCGWGGAAKFVTERYGVQVTGITVSEEQGQIARKNCAGLPVEILVDDYRSLTGHYDRIMSIGMFEHVGYKNYRTYFEIVRKLLKPEGLFLLHTIGSNTTERVTDSWIEKYIFPNSLLPSAVQITNSLENLFVIEDWHSFGADYDRTLMCWYHNFSTAWPELGQHYDERFKRMWEYYLLMCAGSFRARVNQLWQLVLSPEGISGGWRSVR